MGVLAWAILGWEARTATAHSANDTYEKSWLNAAKLAGEEVERSVRVCQPAAKRRGRRSV
jgi:hypothetical protein